ncbi:head-tail adaptor protein [Gardnerella vaginalis]|jgi:phage head-tail adaptor|uniref:phage head completion protein n=1 Tax=Gardnerella vaginalis TaxID=2702 RepID=UPI002010BC53|nr:head-tail adaptor protein [Gardnerella vaginalis]DAN49672.1 MAG TPA: head-tail joining protein [Caudoviricetes sp.]UQA78978.1 head-tail adaptor protein [Gardnerella vaginalis]UQA79480.1 head-tail adaptor protein [Gardnerella vaginalis]UQA82356.1 head-tail adaptor protein [Gardnerella vaginalis]UQA84971.1 head-tail adaptor protein [Gardnerella vaginalis]
MATLGKMSEHIDLIQPMVTKDAAGFATTRDEVIASVRAYMEVRHASPAWVNRAAYTKADLLFRIRAIPGVKITEAMQISSARGRCVIDAVEPIGRYLQILAHRTEAEGTL